VRPRAVAAAALVAIGLGAWALFHPPFRPDAAAVPDAVRAELEKTGFRSTQGVISARFDSVMSGEGYREDWASQQEIMPVDALLTEKRSRRNSKAVSQQFSGLYVGPLAAVRYMRNWPPLIGELLPYSFWFSTRMTEFVIEEHENFPHASGGRMVARVTNETRYGDGTPAITERSRLRCEVRTVIDAASLDARLPGRAVRIECTDSLLPGGRQGGAVDAPFFYPDLVRYSHWYVLERGWSIPVEGEDGSVEDGVATVRKWTSKLVSFD
jgi:hypothetical protein